jgi:maleate cis-trans isomerase
MTTPMPLARLGVVLSSSNRWVEPYFRAHGPDTLAIHPTRMRMASQARAALDVAAADAVEAAQLVADARVDIIDLQMTGLAMAMGAAAEAKLTAAIEDATGIPAYTATQALVEALRALGLKRVLSITPASGRERAYLEAAGIAFADEVVLDLGDGPATAEVPPETWVTAGGRHSAHRRRIGQARGDQRPGGTLGWDMPRQGQARRVYPVPRPRPPDGGGVDVRWPWTITMSE